MVNRPRRMFHGGWELGSFRAFGSWFVDSRFRGDGKGERRVLTLQIGFVSHIWGESRSQNPEFRRGRLAFGVRST